MRFAPFAIIMMLTLSVAVPASAAGRGSVVATPPYDSAFGVFMCPRGSCEGSADGNRSTGMLGAQGRSFPDPAEPVNIALGFARASHTLHTPTHSQFLRVTAEVRIDVDTFASSQAGDAYTFVELSMTARSMAPDCGYCEDVRFKRIATSVDAECTGTETFGQCTWKEPASVHESRKFSMILQDWNDPNGIGAGPVATVVQVRGMSFVEPDSPQNEAGFNASVEVLSITVEPASTKRISHKTQTQFTHEPPFDSGGSTDFCEASGCPPASGADPQNGQFHTEYAVPNPWSRDHARSDLGFVESQYYELAATQYDVVFHLNIDRARAWVDATSPGSAYVLIEFSVEHFGCRSRAGHCLRTVPYVLVEGGRGYPDHPSVAPEEVVDQRVAFPVSLAHPNGALISPDEFRVMVGITSFAQVDDEGSLVHQILPLERAGFAAEGAWASYDVTIRAAPWPEAEFDRLVHF